MDDTWPLRTDVFAAWEQTWEQTSEQTWEQTEREQTEWEEPQEAGSAPQSWFGSALEQVILASNIAAGQRNADDLTNKVFSFRHPDGKGTSEERKLIHDRQVVPLLLSGPPVGPMHGMPAASARNGVPADAVISPLSIAPRGLVAAKTRQPGTIATIVVHTTSRSPSQKSKESGYREPAVKYALDVYLRGTEFPHYVIDFNGTVYATCDERFVAWHAGWRKLGGAAFFRGGWSAPEWWSRVWARQGAASPVDLLPKGASSPNFRSIGVELLILPDLSYTTQQYHALARLIVDIQRRNRDLRISSAPSRALLGHEDVTPIAGPNGRADDKGGWDPGAHRASPYFDWTRLWTDIRAISPGFGAEAFESQEEDTETEDTEDTEEEDKAATQDRIASEAELGVGGTPFYETPFYEFQADQDVPSDVRAFAARLGAEWSRRRNGNPSPEAMTSWLVTDYGETLQGARLRWKERFGKGRFTIEAIGRAWQISREENMRFQLEGERLPALERFAPPATSVPLVSSSLIEDSVKAPVAPLVGAFAEQLRLLRSGYLNMANYGGHGGGAFNGRGFSLDLSINGLDERGFYPRADAVRFLREVDAAAKAVGAQWRVIYNDFAVADAVNSALGRRHVIFMGKARKSGATVKGLNWHGPAPLILHFHLDLAPR